MDTTLSTEPLPTNLSECQLLVYDTSTKAARNRIKREGLWEAFVARRQAYTDAGCTPKDSWIRAANDFPASPEQEFGVDSKGNDLETTPFQPGEFWKGLVSQWRRARDTSDMEPFLKLSAILSRKMKFTTLDEDKPEIETADELLAWLDRMDGVKSENAKV